MVNHMIFMMLFSNFEKKKKERFQKAAFSRITFSTTYDDLGLRRWLLKRLVEIRRTKKPTQAWDVNSLFTLTFNYVDLK